MTPAALAALLVLAGLPSGALAQIGSSSAQKAFTLEDARRLALINDARLLSAEQDKIISRERVQEARYLFLPEVGLQASATKYEARYPFSLSGPFRNILLFPDSPSPYGGSTGNIYSGRGYLQLSLYEGGRTINTLRLAQAAQKQAFSNHESVRMDIVYGVVEVFYKLLLSQEKVKATEEYRKAIEGFVDGGPRDAWDRLEAEALLGEARAKLSEARHELDLGRLAFLKSLNLELDTPFSVNGLLESKAAAIDIDRAVLWALELRPELQSETYKAQMDAISVNLASARRHPTVFLGGDYELTAHDFPLKRNNWDATIGVKIPFSYDFWTQLRQKRAEQRQGQLKRAELQDQVRLEVRRAYESLQYWQAEWPEREKRYRRVAELFDAASRQGGSSFARVRALASLLNLKVSYYSAVTEHILARARLERAVGRELN